MIRSSQSHPLRIAELPVGANGGAIGVTFAPGKCQPDAMTGHWARDLDQDLDVISVWGATHLISLIEPWEYKDLSIEALPERAAAHGLQWHGLPITDGAAPDQRFLRPWAQLGPALVRALQTGGRVVIHCKGGLGRAGTVACLLLLDSGLIKSTEEAICRVRAVRPGAIESLAQEDFVRNWKRKPTESARRSSSLGTAERGPTGAHIAYCEYFATGEGVTLLVAVGCSALHAERVFRTHADPYFHPGMVVERLDSAAPRVRHMVRMVPQTALQLFERMEGGPQYYGEVHFNLS